MLKRVLFPTSVSIPTHWSCQIFIKNLLWFTLRNKDTGNNILLYIYEIFANQRCLQLWVILLKIKLSHFQLKNMALYVWVINSYLDYSLINVPTHCWSSIKLFLIKPHYLVGTVYNWKVILPIVDIVKLVRFFLNLSKWGPLLEFSWYNSIQSF